MLRTAVAVCGLLLPVLITADAARNSYPGLPPNYASPEYREHVSDGIEKGSYQGELYQYVNWRYTGCYNASPVNWSNTANSMDSNPGVFHNYTDPGADTSNIGRYSYEGCAAFCWSSYQFAKSNVWQNNTYFGVFQYIDHINSVSLMDRLPSRLLRQRRAEWGLLTVII